MADNYQKFSTFIEGVCNKFGCKEAVRPLQEGFSALCEANGITAGRYAFGMVDEEAKNLLGNQDIEGFKDYVRANSSSVFRDAAMAKFATAEKLAKDKGPVDDMVVTRVLVDDPKEKLVLLRKEPEQPGTIDNGYFYYAAMV